MREQVSDVHRLGLVHATAPRTHLGVARGAGSSENRLSSGDGGTQFQQCGHPPCALSRCSSWSIRLRTLTANLAGRGPARSRPTATSTRPPLEAGCRSQAHLEPQRPEPKPAHLDLRPRSKGRLQRATLPSARRPKARSTRRCRSWRTRSRNSGSFSHSKRVLRLMPATAAASSLEVPAASATTARSSPERPISSSFVRLLICWPPAATVRAGEHRGRVHRGAAST